MLQPDDLIHRDGGHVPTLYVVTPPMSREIETWVGCPCGELLDVEPTPGMPEVVWAADDLEGFGV